MKKSLTDANKELKNNLQKSSNSINQLNKSCVILREKIDELTNENKDLREAFRTIESLNRDLKKLIEIQNIDINQAKYKNIAYKEIIKEIITK